MQESQAAQVEFLSSTITEDKKHCIFQVNTNSGTAYLSVPVDNLNNMFVCISHALSLHTESKWLKDGEMYAHPVMQARAEPIGPDYSILTIFSLEAGEKDAKQASFDVSFRLPKDVARDFHSVLGHILGGPETGGYKRTKQ